MLHGSSLIGAGNTPQLSEVGASCVLRDIEPQETKRFEQALGGAFELAAQEGEFEVLRRRREGISDTVCAGIAE